MSDIVEEGIFSNKVLNNNQVEFCICSDLHIANDKSGKKKARNDYVFNEEGKPLSDKAYMLQRFCDRITVSGKQCKFYDVGVNDSGRRLNYYNTGKFSRDLCLNLLVEQDYNGNWFLVENY